MKCLIPLLALCTVTASATGQSLRINVPRSAYDYEQVATVPRAVSQAADQKIITEFLTSKRLAGAAFEERALASCPEYVGGKITVMEFAARLDREAVRMNNEKLAAYERMNDRLSSSGRSALQNSLDRSAMTADTQAVAIVETAPAVAESKFLQRCAEAGVTAPTADGAG